MSPGTTGHGVPAMPAPLHHLLGRSVLAGNLLLPSRDQVIEGHSGDAGSEMRASEGTAGLSWLPAGSQRPRLVEGGGSPGDRMACPAAGEGPDGPTKDQALVSQPRPESHGQGGRGSG